jgi:ribosomal protein L11 methyltransferase
LGHLRRRFRLSADLEDQAVAELWAAGTSGVQAFPEPDGRLILEAWFAEGAPPVDLAALPGVELVGEEHQPATDWLAVYRGQARPFPVAQTFWVDPRDPDEDPTIFEDPVPNGRRLLRLPARAAFGIGSHESTRLALELLERTDLAGRRVLDVGTGTGVLAFAALLLGAAAVDGYDDDPASPFHARVNSRLNGLAPRLFTGRSAALATAPRWDLALINVVPEQILPELPALAGRLRPAGELIFSGILGERGRQVLERLRALHLTERDRATEGDWVAFRLGFA